MVELSEQGEVAADVRDTSEPGDRSSAHSEHLEAEEVGETLAHASGPNPIANLKAWTQECPGGDQANEHSSQRAAHLDEDEEAAEGEASCDFEVPEGRLWAEAAVVPVYTPESCPSSEQPTHASDLADTERVLGVLTQLECLVDSRSAVVPEQVLRRYERVAWGSGERPIDRTVSWRS